MAAEASQYRETLALEQAMKSDTEIRRKWLEEQATFNFEDEESRGRGAGIGGGRGVIRGRVAVSHCAGHAGQRRPAQVTLRGFLQQQAARLKATAMFDVTGSPITPTVPVLSTPIGMLVTYFEGAGRSTAGVQPDETSGLPSGALLYRFVRQRWAAELLIGPVVPEIPSHMALAGCLAAIWRVQAIEHTPACRFVCSWPSPPADADGSPSGGGGLDAFTWRVGRHALSLGTEDGEFLSARAKRSNLVPSRLSGELSFSTVEYGEAGLIVPFSGLEAAGRSYKPSNKRNGIFHPG